MVNLTRIYTRTGDAGQTRLGDNSVDLQERPAAARVRRRRRGQRPSRPGRLGRRRSSPTSPPSLVHVQNDLFDVGADLCTPVVPDPEYPPLRVEQSYVDRLEAWCDQYNEPLEALRSFILSGGTPGSAHLHVCRTVVRRAERSAWAAYDEHADVDEPAGDHLPEPALRPALHPGPLLQPRAGRRPVGARRGALDDPAS